MLHKEILINLWHSPSSVHVTFYIFLKHGALDFYMADNSHDCVLELQKQNNGYCGHMHLNFKCNPEALNSHGFLLILGNMISMHYKQWLFIRDFHM